MMETDHRWLSAITRLESIAARLEEAAARPESRPWGVADFLKYFEDFLLAHPELPATRFGAFAASDRGFMTRMRSGERANLSIRKLERVVEFIKTYKPALRVRPRYSGS